MDGDSIDAFFFVKSKNKWTDAPPISEAVFTNEEAAIAYAGQILQHARSLRGSSLGVVVHVADEFATAELKPELDNPAFLQDIRETAVDTPGDILDDSSVPADQASWRVIPYPAAGSEVIGTTVTTSRRLDLFFNVLRDLGNRSNFPIITHSLSSPLVIIAGLHSVVREDRAKPFVALMQYPWFTVMAFFNEHHDLRLIRTLQHRGVRRPSNFRHALATTNASLEFEEPDIYVVPLGAETDHAVSTDLSRSFPDSLVETVKFPVHGAVQQWAPEAVLSVEEIPEDTGGTSYTFGLLRTEKWFLQDFLPAVRETKERFPGRSEMRLLRVLKFARVALFAVAFLGLAWLAFSALTILRRPEWTFNEGDAQSVKQRLMSLTQQRKRIDHWNNLLEDRSKAWTSMEAMARLFPEQSGLLLKTFSHTVQPDGATAKQAKVGFTKSWVITGMARDGALEYLNALNSRGGISGHFSEIAKVTGNSAFDPTPTTRTLVGNVRTQENASFEQRPLEEIVDSDEDTYPFTFNLTITQRFESTDPLAISTTTAP